jgi:hypothetical protein
MRCPQVPRFYVLPRDYEEFRADAERFPDRLFIQKVRRHGSVTRAPTRSALQPHSRARCCRDG